MARQIQSYLPRPLFLLIYISPPGNSVLCFLCVYSISTVNPHRQNLCAQPKLAFKTRLAPNQFTSLGVCFKVGSDWLRTHYVDLAGPKYLCHTRHRGESDPAKNSPAAKTNLSIASAVFCECLLKINSGVRYAQRHL